MTLLYPAGLLLCLSGCATDVAPDAPLQVRLEIDGRVAAATVWPLRLEVADGLEVVVNLRPIDSRHVFATFTILRQGRVIDEPDAIIEIGGGARFDVDMEPTLPMVSHTQGTCPLSAAFAPFHTSFRMGVRLSIMRTS